MKAVYSSCILPISITKKRLNLVDTILPHSTKALALIPPQTGLQKIFLSFFYYIYLHMFLVYEFAIERAKSSNVYKKCFHTHFF